MPLPVFITPIKVTQVPKNNCVSDSDLWLFAQAVELIMLVFWRGRGPYKALQVNHLSTGQTEIPISTGTLRKVQKNLLG